MLRVIFDTNVYGLLIEESNTGTIRKRILDDSGFVIYGFGPVRKELRDTPKEKKLGTLCQRSLLLSTYDELTKGRYLKESLRINHLALRFYNAYRQFNGIRRWKDIGVDFTIVACASTYCLDIVVSDDSGTMLSKSALKAYKHITAKENIHHPDFWSYRDLKRKFSF